MEFEQDPKTNSSPVGESGFLKSLLSKLPAWIVYALLAVAFAFLLYVAYQLYGFLRDFNDAVSILSDRYGINTWLAKAIALVLVGPLAWGFKKSLWPTDKRMGIRIATSVYACIYFLTMYWVSLDASFSHKTGEILQWYAETPEGIRFFDTDGYDQKYGIRLKPVTPELKIALERRKRGQIPKQVGLEGFESLNLYDQLTGATSYWYGTTPTGDYALYDGPGIDPKTQAVLRPVSPEVAQDIRRSIQSRRQQVALAEETNRREQAREQAEIREKAAVAEEANRREQARQKAEIRLASLRKLFSCSSSGKRPAAMAIRSKGDSTVSEAVAKNLISSPGFRQRVEIDFFRPAFVEGAYFDRAFGGDVAFLREAGAFTCVKSIVLGETWSKCGSIVNGVLSCDVNLNYRVISESGTRVAGGILAATGAGFDVTHATDTGARALAQTKSQEILHAVPNI